MRSLQRHEGYLLIDNTNGPGISEEYIRKTWPGRFVPTAAEGKKYESAIVHCVHCSQGLVLNPLRTRPRGYCRKCDAYVCDKPTCNSDCDPFARVLDRAEARQFKAEAVGWAPGKRIILP